MPLIALTAGDPAGIGPELALAAWQQRRSAGLPPFYLLCDPEFVMASAGRRDVPVRCCAPEEAAAHFDHALPVVALKHAFFARPGRPDPKDAVGIVEAIDRAVQDTLSARADALVTGPIAKKPLYDAGFDFPGHTEYLAHLAQRAAGEPRHPVMMLAGPSLRTIPVTVHVPLARVPALLNADLICRTARIAHIDLRDRFGIAAPRLVVAGLNPHAGEGGALGEEDDAIIAPAVSSLRKEGIDARGPLPADTIFHERARETYDVALCMYHDQALIPAKTLDFDRTVNVTLGLPFIRTSPDHGTAFDIAGKDVARPDSLIAAIRMAAEMAKRRAASS